MSQGQENIDQAMESMGGCNLLGFIDVLRAAGNFHVGVQPHVYFHMKQTQREILDAIRAFQKSSEKNSSVLPEFEVNVSYRRITGFMSCNYLTSVFLIKCDSGLPVNITDLLTESGVYAYRSLMTKHELTSVMSFMKCDLDLCFLMELILLMVDISL